MSFVGDNKAKVNGYINDRNLIDRVETWIDNPFSATCCSSPFTPTTGRLAARQFPTHIVQKQAGYPIFDLTHRRREGERGG